MPDNNVEVQIMVSLKEASMIGKLRKIDFGICEVHKVNGEPVRVVLKENISLSEQDGMIEAGRKREKTLDNHNQTT